MQRRSRACMSSNDPIAFTTRYERMRVSSRAERKRKVFLGIASGVSVHGEESPGMTGGDSLGMERGLTGFWPGVFWLPRGK